MMDFKNKVCVITGGAQGIGLCLVQTFAQQGATVAFIDTCRAEGEAAADAITAQGGQTLFFCGDVGSSTALEAFVGQVTAQYGKVDYLINNACLTRQGVLTPCNYEDFNYVLQVGVAAPYWLSQLLLPHFAPNAAIVNISSTRVAMSQPNTESYTAAKGGISALTHALAISLAGRVRVNCVAPGWIDTGAYHSTQHTPTHTAADLQQHPSRRIGQPEDIARAVLFLCDCRNSFINGETITVDGGMTKQMIYAGDEGWQYTPQT